MILIDFGRRVHNLFKELVNQKMAGNKIYPGIYHDLQASLRDCRKSLNQFFRQPL